MEHDVIFAARYAFDMLSEWLQKALAASGRSQSDVARMLTETVNRSIDRAAVNKMTKGTRKIAADELIAMARYLNAPAPTQNLGLRSVTVAAHVQAGHWAEHWEWADDEKYEVAVPADPVLDGFQLYGAETRGPSMNRRWPEKTVVVFTNVMETEESLTPGKRYIVQRERADGLKEHTVKLLYQDEKGKFWLVPESTDPLFQQPISVEEGSYEGDTVAIIGRVHYSVARE